VGSAAGGGKAPSLAGRFAAAIALTIGFYVRAIALALIALPIYGWAEAGRGNVWLTIFCLFTGGSILAAIALGRELNDTGDALIERFVGEARAADLSWTEIGRLFGTSKQAAQKRYGAAAAEEARLPGRWAPAAHEVFEQAGQQARVLGHNYVGHGGHRRGDEGGRPARGDRHAARQRRSPGPVPRAAVDARRRRELARGIHPAVLTDRGLGPALETLANRAPVPVDIAGDVPDDLPVPAATALYFVASEALTNVAKYARAGHATVTVERIGQRVVLAVADDGVGGADIAGGSGLRGLADRLAALDGRLEVHSPPGAGTVLRAEIPL
jgi:signal transduction histidine kinase